MGDEAKYILQPLLGHIETSSYSAPVTVCSMHQYDEVGIERYGQRATLINGACCSDQSSSIIRLTLFWGGGTDECRGLPEYGVGGH
jgi:hypothetical protein